MLVWLEKMTCFMLKKYGDNRRSFSPMPIAHVSQLSSLYIKQSRAINILLSFILSGIFFRASGLICDRCLLFQCKNRRRFGSSLKRGKTRASISEH